MGRKRRRHRRQPLYRRVMEIGGVLLALVLGGGAAGYLSLPGAEEFLESQLAEEAAGGGGWELLEELWGEKQEPASSVSADEIPEYTGQAWVEVEGGQPLFTQEDRQRTDAFEEYSPLDQLGRCGPAYANVCLELMPTEERGQIGQVKPSGWHTVKYDVIADRYLYNRCHLIGYQLAGENANERNLITGTRYMNTTGMLPYEDQVADYVKETGNHVLYRVTPVFVGEELVARGVRMEAWSVEDQGDGVCFHVFVFNVQPGVEIDYATGDSWLSDDGAETEDQTGVSWDEDGADGQLAA